MREGTIANPTMGAATPPPYVNAPPFEEPIHDYGHGSGDCAVIGGSVYRGPLPELRGLYYFADFCTGKFWTIDRSTQPPTVDEITGDMGAASSGFVIVAISEGVGGELYVVHSGGSIYRIGPSGALVPGPAPGLLAALVVGLAGCGAASL